uniref:Fe2OG dioxygenase domain-containing protein n=1 Tax=Chrysotila carterae TaxID=13221 RepID=A0A7S4C221_CHRCT|mmetsp:Transcript_28641/g.60196  ORF Transcript_28641/g.60196 Transcript_28641/m.60196 type:complete len:268 (+) Transcript_28641:244-1047(+)
MAATQSTGRRSAVLTRKLEGGASKPVTSIIRKSSEHAPPKRVTRVGNGAQSYLYFHAVLSGRQLLKAREFAASEAVQLALGQGKLFDESREAETRFAQHARSRQSRIAWLERTAELGLTDGAATVPAWLHATLRRAAKEAHARFGDVHCPVGYDAAGRWTPRYEPIQYSEYVAGCHYASWHTDAEAHSHDDEDTRAITIVLLLSDRSAFAGGELQVRLGGAAAPTSVGLRAGDAIAFPAKWLSHRVTEVSAGLRQSLVFWVNRPGGS